jgi:hypothetical protein
VKLIVDKKGAEPAELKALLDNCRTNARELS